MVWTSGASCNSNLWTLVSNLLSRHPYLWIFQPLFLWIDPIYSFPLFIDGKSSWQGLACSQERLAGDQGAWFTLEPSPGMVCPCCFVSLSNGFPFHQLYLTTPFWRAGMCLALALSCLQGGHRKQSHISAGHWYPFLLWKLTFGTWGTCEAAWSAPLLLFSSLRGQVIESQSKYIL